MKQTVAAENDAVLQFCLITLANGITKTKLREWKNVNLTQPADLTYFCLICQAIWARSNQGISENRRTAGAISVLRATKSMIYVMTPVRSYSALTMKVCDKVPLKHSFSKQETAYLNTGSEYVHLFMATDSFL